MPLPLEVIDETVILQVVRVPALPIHAHAQLIAA